MSLIKKLGIRTVKALVTDIDGTLTDEKRILNLDALKALREAYKANIHIILCSSRMFATVSALAKYLGFESPIIAESGAIVGYPWKPVFVKEIPPDTRHKIVEIMLQMGFEEIPYNNCRVGDLGFYRTERSKNITEEEILATLQRYGINRVNVFDSGFAVHITPENVDKGYGLMKAIELINASVDEVIVIGDGNNDIPMFKVAKYSIAPSNASEELKKFAKIVSDLPDGKLIIALVNELLSQL
ncbi:MAG: phosphoglycolate phosphatase [Candidatus Njordarchaeales archaeon]